jgi:hypothetical protein
VTEGVERVDFDAEILEVVAELEGDAFVVGLSELDRRDGCSARMRRGPDRSMSCSVAGSRWVMARMVVLVSQRAPWSRRPWALPRGSLKARLGLAKSITTLLLSFSGVSSSHRVTSRRLPSGEKEGESAPKGRRR